MTKIVHRQPTSHNETIPQDFVVLHTALHKKLCPVLEVIPSPHHHQHLLKEAKRTTAKPLSKYQFSKTRVMLKSLHNL